MQQPTLVDNLNADYLAAFSALQPKGSPQRVLVYVESDDDIAFWRVILAPFEKNGVRFDVQLASNDTLTKGKLPVLVFANSVGNHLILCVDSDYDYLLQNTTSTSTLINNNKFIFQTYGFSIENLLCYADSLHTVCVQATKNDTRMIEFVPLMELYSKIVYPLFLWSVYFAEKKDTIADEKKDTTSFTITNFCDTVKILDKAVVTEQFRVALQGVKNRVVTKVQELEEKFPDAKPHIETLGKRLQSLGVEQDNTYLFMRGHTVKDNVVLMFLKPLIEALRKKKESQIKEKAKHNTALKNQWDYYKKQVIPLENALNGNTEYKSCFLYKKIQHDLEQYIKGFKNDKSS